MLRREEKLASEEAERMEELRAAEVENRRHRVVANIEGRAKCGRPQNAMDLSELGDALRDADSGGARYDSQPKRSSKISPVPSADRLGQRDSDTDSDQDDVDAVWDKDSDVGSVVSDSAGIDEDMQRREEELQEELKIATVRCSQLKATLKETKVQC